MGIAGSQDCMQIFLQVTILYTTSVISTILVEINIMIHKRNQGCTYCNLFFHHRENLTTEMQLHIQKEVILNAQRLDIIVNPLKQRRYN